MSEKLARPRRLCAAEAIERLDKAVVVPRVVEAEVVAQSR